VYREVMEPIWGFYLLLSWEMTAVARQERGRLRARTLCVHAGALVRRDALICSAIAGQFPAAKRARWVILKRPVNAYRLVRAGNAAEKGYAR
jgi:hypothetical protein